MKQVVLAAALLASACHQTPQSVSVYLQLVDAGCLTADDAGVGQEAVTQELAGDAALPWCPTDGAPITSCNVCGADQ